MKKALKAVFAAAVIFTILLSMLPGAFTLRAGAVSEQSAADGIFSDELKRTGAKNIQALLDGVYAQNAGITSDWLVFSLIQYEGGKYDYSKYASSLKKYSSGSGYDNSVTKERIALMFAAMNTGGDYIGKTVNNEINGLGIMSRIFGLHLLANGYSSSSVNEDGVIDYIISNQLGDGGWALKGDTADTEVTAMAVQALAHYSGRDKVKKSISKALEKLSEMQQPDGGYLSMGKKNPESAAQVIVALTALKTDPRSDPRFIKNGKSAVDFMLSFKASDYGYSHEAGGKYNLTATSQVLYALVSIIRMQKGAGQLYDLKPGVSVKDSELTSSSSGKILPTAKTSTASRTQTADTDSRPSSKQRQTVTGTTASMTAYSRRTTTAAPSKSKNNSETASNTVTVSSSAEKSTKNSHAEKSGTSAAFSESAVSSAAKVTEQPEATASMTEKTAGFLKAETTADETLENTHGDIKNESETESAGNNGGGKFEFNRVKKYIVCGIWAAAGIGAAILLIKKKRKALNFIIIFALAAAGTAGTLFAEIKTADEYYKEPGETGGSTVTVTMSITCDTVAGRGEESITPSDGIILPETRFELKEGSTVYDCLIHAAKKYKIQIEDNTQTLGDHSHAYIAGINYLYEFDYGELSGWMYSVNGEFADRGCGEYTLSNNDVIKWQYTTNLGDDLK